VLTEWPPDCYYLGMNFSKVEGNATERNDCTVLAVSIAAEMDYATAHALLKSNGRKDRHRFNFLGFMEPKGSVRPELGRYSVKRMTTDARTINQFIAANPNGRFIVCKRGHVFAVVNGVLYDQIMTGPKARIKQVWSLSQ
jgi:hypothetical protein